MKDFELTVAQFTRARCETRRSRDIFCTEWSKDSDCLVSRSSCMCQWRRSLGVGHSTTDHIPVSQQMGVNLIHIEVAHSILTACSCLPHWRTPAETSETTHTKMGACEFGICRANREVSKSFAFVVASAIWKSE